jgi:hypothetical protein
MGATREYSDKDRGGADQAQTENIAPKSGGNTFLFADRDAV